jgi:dihydropteroate synthase
MSLGQFWQTSRFRVDLSQPRVMGIVNVTPDSFSDGGQWADAGIALRHCEQLVAHGADILDIGGESSRPGAEALSVEAELARVLPVLDGALTLGVPVSVDTCKPEVMRVALDRGADIINDIHALTRPGALELLAAHANAGVCLMHMRGDPGTMQAQLAYADVTAEVAAYLTQRAAAVQQAGIAAERIVLDPGYGFAKSPEQNFQLLREQMQLCAMGHPLLAGWSRKSSLGVLTGKPVGDRLAGSIAAALAAVAHGAKIVRVHDVAQTADALKVWRAAGAPAGR